MFSITNRNKGFISGKNPNNSSCLPLQNDIYSDFFFFRGFAATFRDGTRAAVQTLCSNPKPCKKMERFIITLHLWGIPGRWWKLLFIPKYTMSLLTKVCQGFFSVAAHLTSLFCAHQRKDPPLQGSWKKKYWVFSSILINWEVSVMTEKASFNGSTKVHVLWILFFPNLSENAENAKEFM